MVIGLQLYSIRELITEDNLWDVLGKVQAAGFNAVEFAGYYDVPAKEFKAKLEELGLEPYSSHVPYEHLKDKLDEVVEYSKDIGLSWVICPFARTETVEQIEELAKVLIAAQEALEPYGIKVGYHNHSHEFNEIDGKYALDHLREATKGRRIFFEIDCCWAQYANVKPAEYLNDLGQSMGPVHFKDLNENYKEIDPHAINAVVGQGIVDFEAVFDTMEKHGTLQNGVIVEQEGFVGDPWEELASAVQWIVEHKPE